MSSTIDYILDEIGYHVERRTGELMKARTAKPAQVAKGRPGQRRQLSERERLDIRRGVAAAELEMAAARTVDPETSRQLASRAAQIRRDIKEGRS